MKKTIATLGAIAALGMFYHTEKANALEIGVTSDTFYSLETEVAGKTLELSTGLYGIGLSSEFAFNLTDAEYDGVVLGADWDTELVGFGLTPYVEYEMDGDSEHVDTVIGIEVSKKFSF